MFDFKNIFPSPSKPNRSIQIKNDIVVRLADGTTRHCSAGETVEVTHRDSLGLDPNDFAFLDKETREPIQIDKAPERPEAAPLPARWEQLPNCFADWHNLNEKFRVAGLHKKLITESRVKVFGTPHSIGNPSGDVATLITANAMFGRGMNPQSNSREIRLDDPFVQAQEREFQRAEKNALDHLEELRNTYSLPLQRLHLACGNARLDSVESLTAITQEIRAIGLELFSARVAALELHPQQVARLYAGSSLFVKYATHTDPHICGTAFAGYDASGNIRTYVDDEVVSIAAGLLSDIDRTSELAPLLAEGRKELSKAQKVAA